jgi:hypothetical protein
MSSELITIEEGPISIGNCHDIGEFDIIGEYNIKVHNCYNIHTLNIIRSIDSPILFINCSLMNVFVYNTDGVLKSSIYIGKVNEMTLTM